MDHFQWKSTFLIIIANNKPSKGPIDCAAIITSCCTKLSLFSRDAFFKDGVMPSADQPTWPLDDQVDPFSTVLFLVLLFHQYYAKRWTNLTLGGPRDLCPLKQRCFLPPAPSCNKACLLFSSFRTHFLFVLAAAASEKNSLKQICAVCTFQCYLCSSTAPAFADNFF